MEGGMKNGVIGKLFGELKFQTWFLMPIKIRLNPKDEPSIFKIERVMWVFVKQPEAKMSIKQEFQISRFWSVRENCVKFFAGELNSYIGPTSI